MVTNSQDYEEMLWQLQQDTPTKQAILLPTDEQIYDINLNTRTISVPKFLSVEKDHHAETVYFKFNRYYDHIDLSTMCCVIEYTNAAGKSYVYPVPYQDVRTFADYSQVIIPWCIQGPATAEAGTIKFAIRWYQVNDNKQLSYSLRTLVAQSQILQGQNEESSELDYENIDLDSNLLELIQEIQYAYENNVLALYWVDT